MILGQKGGSSLVQNHLRSQILRRKIREPTVAELNTAVAPVTHTEVNATRLQLVPNPVMDTEVDTTIHTNSEDKPKAHVHIHQKSLVSADGKALRYSSGSEGIGASDDCWYKQRSQFELGKSTLT